MFSTNKKIQRFTERHHKEANFGELLERYQAMLVQIDEPMLARVAIQQLLERDSSLDIHKPLNLATIQETAGLTLSGPSETITSMDLIDRHPRSSETTAKSKP